MAELAGNRQICLLCQGALQEIISSMFGLYSSNDFAQSPTPILIEENGSAFFKALRRGVHTRTSPKSLLRRIKMFFGLEECKKKDLSSYFS